jgi:hypothetical protein
MQGLAWLHAGILQVFEPTTSGWTVWGLGDDPEARIENLLALLRQRRFSLAVLGGHGNTREAGVSLKNGCWCGGGADLSSLDFLVLMACAVGRVNQQGDRDVEGLYSRLLVHRGRCVLAARWKIADAEAAGFITEVLRHYRRQVGDGQTFVPFARARALNEARKQLVGPVEEQGRVSFHLASAFEIYGVV